MGNSNSTAYYEVGRDLFDYDDTNLSEPGTSEWESMFGTAESLAPENYARPLNNAATAILRWKEAKPLPGAGVSGFNGATYRRYRATAEFPLDYMPTDTSVLIQVDDSSNYLRARIDHAGNKIYLEKIQGAVVSQNLGSGTVTPASFDQWTDPTVLSFEYWPTDTSAGVVTEAHVRCFANGELLNFSVSGNDETEIELSNAPRNWLRKSGLHLPVNSRVKMFLIESREGGGSLPYVEETAETATQVNVALYGRKFIPSSIYGFPVHDSNRTHAETQWDLDVTISGSWVPVTPPANVTTGNLRFVVFPLLTVGATYRARYRYKNDSAEFSSWSDYLEFTVAGTVPLTGLTNSSAAFPMFPISDVGFDETIAFDVHSAALSTGEEYRVSWRERPIRSFSISLRAKTQNQIDKLWDFYQARKGSAESFWFVHPYQSSAFSARFSEDSLSRRNFAALVYSSGLKLVELF